MARRGREEEEEGKGRDRKDVRSGGKSEEQKGKEIGEGPRARREKR